MIAALSILGFMEDGGANYLDLPDTQVSLEIFHIVIRIPKTPFNI